MLMKLTNTQKLTLAFAVGIMALATVGTYRAMDIAVEKAAARVQAQEPAHETADLDDAAMTNVEEAPVSVDLEFLEWESLEDADLTEMEIVYDDPLLAPTITEDGTIQLPEELPQAEPVIVREWGDKIVYRWFVEMYDSVVSRQFYLTAGQAFYISGSYTPADKPSYFGYVTPDKKCHVISYDSTVAKTIVIKTTGNHRIAFFNRSSKRIYVAGYYKKSK